MINPMIRITAKIAKTIPTMTPIGSESLLPSELSSAEKRNESLNETDSEKILDSVGVKLILSVKSLENEKTEDSVKSSESVKEIEVVNPEEVEKVSEWLKS